MSAKVRIKYNHPMKKDVVLEVIGHITDSNDTTLIVTRIDGYPIDIPLDAIISTEELTKQ